MRKVFVINGPARAGKGTFIKMCRMYLASHNIPVYSFTSIFPIKKDMIEKGLWDGVSEKTTAIRTSMVKIKEKMSMDGIPNRYVLEQIEETEDNAIVFVHIREPKEIQNFLELFKKKFGQEAHTLHYHREDPDLAEFESGVDVLAETRAFGKYDYDVENPKPGLEEMKLVVRSFLVQLFPDLNFEDFDVDDLENPVLHKQFNDEESVGII
jgi:hypothetical protein